MSFSSSRRNALDLDRPLMHRASHARSRAMLVAQKWKVHRDEVFARVITMCSVDLTSAPSSGEIIKAIDALEHLRFHWHDDSASNESPMQGNS